MTAGAATDLFTVNQLAEELGVTARAIRFYEAKGLIAPGRAGTTRVFDRRDRARLLLVLRGKRLGFTLGEIAEYLDLYDADPSQRAQVALLLEKVRNRCAEMEAQRRDLDEALGDPGRAAIVQVHVDADDVPPLLARLGEAVARLQSAARAG